MKLNKYHILLLIIINAASCRFYSFTGASIDPNAKTFSVDYFKNNAQTFNPNLSQDLTESLRKKLTSQTTLSLVDGKGDLQFKGEITDYSVTPVSLTANETAAKNRLTIVVKVEFINEFDEKMNFSQTFSRYSDYESNKILTAVEPELVPEIVNQLTEDIFQKAVVNW
jgi:nitrogen regulatory protein PII